MEGGKSKEISFIFQLIEDHFSCRLQIEFCFPIWYRPRFGSNQQNLKTLFWLKTDRLRQKGNGGEKREKREERRKLKKHIARKIYVKREIFGFFIQSRSFVHYNNIHDIPRSILHIMVMSIWFARFISEPIARKQSAEECIVYTWNNKHWMIFDTSTFQNSMRSILMSTSLAVFGMY